LDVFMLLEIKKDECLVLCRFGGFKIFIIKQR